MTTGMINVYTAQNGGLIITVPPEQEAAFKELVHRAVNLWPDASPEIKHFADIITNGAPMQDYKKQDFKLSNKPR